MSMEKNKALNIAAMVAWTIAVSMLVAVGMLVFALAKPDVTEDSNPEKHRLYLQEVSQTDNGLVGEGIPEVLIQFGEETCEVLDAGFTMNEAVVHLAVQLGDDDPFGEIPEFIQVVITSAVHQICPRHSNLLY